MSNNEIIISVVTAVLVVFSLFVSVVIPKRDPNFPGRRNLVTFGIICMVLVGGTLAAVEVYGAEEGHAEAATAEGEPGAPAEGDGEGPPAEAPPPGDEAAPGPPPAGGPGDASAGREVFVRAGCASCHVLSDADASGTIGPNLDESLPPFELVVDRVTNGAGAMPAFSGQLGEADIEDVAAYVVSATSG